MSVMIGSILCLVLIALLDPSLALPAKKQVNSPRRCFVNGNIYAHGQVFSLPGSSRCLKYRCDNGGWSASVEACEHNGICHPVGSTYVDRCRTYQCTVTRQQGYSFYQSINTRTRCQDSNGVCRDPGTVFPYVINARSYNRCSCTVQGDNYVRYNCN